MGGTQNKKQYQIHFLQEFDPDHGKKNEVILSRPIKKLTFERPKDFLKRKGLNRQDKNEELGLDR